MSRVTTLNGCDVAWHGPSELKPVEYVCSICSQAIHRTQRTVHFRKRHSDDGRKRVPRETIHAIYRPVFVVKVEVARRSPDPVARVAFTRVCKTADEALLYAEGVVGGASALQNCSADLFAGEKDATLRLVLR